VEFSVFACGDYVAISHSHYFFRVELREWHMYVYTFFVVTSHMQVPVEKSFQFY